VENKARTIHFGYVADGENRITRYFTDDRDSLPADIRGYTIEQYVKNQWSWTAFFYEVFKGEKEGFRYNIQIGDLFYETPEA
jgi:hypothetical protein